MNRVPKLINYLRHTVGIEYREIANDLGCSVRTLYNLKKGNPDEFQYNSSLYTLALERLVLKHEAWRWEEQISNLALRIKRVKTEAGL